MCTSKMGLSTLGLVTEHILLIILLISTLSCVQNMHFYIYAEGEEAMILITYEYLMCIKLAIHPHS